VSEPTLVLALVAGLASFLSPCMLPVIPAFLAQLAGTSLDVSDLKRREVLLGIFLFVVGFAAVFALLGVVLGAVLQGMGVLVFTNKLSLLANFQLLNEVLL
jgi:cytochrome c-type biogenesis protein